MTALGTCCVPHPDSGHRMVTGQHLAGCTVSSCQGCVVCSPDCHRPPQRPAANSDARKRNTERRTFRNQFESVCACGDFDIEEPLMGGGLLHDVVVCLNPEKAEVTP